MKKYTLCVGLNDKDTKLQRISTLEAYKIVENTILSKEITGYTIHEGRGLYQHEETGEIVQETTLIIDLMYVEEEVINKMINTLKVVLNQESILKQVQEIEVEFV